MEATPLVKQDKKEKEKSQLPTRKAIKKALLEKAGRRCVDCYRKTVPVRLVRIHKKSKQLKQTDYILLCHDCIIKRQEKRKEDKKRLWEWKPTKRARRKISKTGFLNRVRKKVIQRDSYRCVWCNTDKKIGLGSLIPESRGGKRCIENYVACCQKCRPNKGNKLPLEYLWRDIDVDEYLHEQFDHALRVKDPGKNITIRFFLFSEISSFLHRLTNDGTVPDSTRSRAELLNIKLLSN
jgi:5-methylcytosine-specific restriction endonuclease McrA